MEVKELWRLSCWSPLEHENAKWASRRERIFLSCRGFVIRARGNTSADRKWEIQIGSDFFFSKGKRSFLFWWRTGRFLKELRRFANFLQSRTKFWFMPQDLSPVGDPCSGSVQVCFNVDTNWCSEWEPDVGTPVITVSSWTSLQDWVQHVYHTEEVRLFLEAFYKFIWGWDSKSFTSYLQQMWRQQLIQYNFVFTNQSAWVLHLYQHFHHFWISLVCMLQTRCWRYKLIFFLKRVHLLVCVVSKTACSTGWHGRASFWWEAAQIFLFPAVLFKRKHQLGGLLLRKICICGDIGRAQWSL